MKLLILVIACDGLFMKRAINWLYASDITLNTYYYVHDIKNAIIPNFIEIIEPVAFGRCKYLQKVEFQIDTKLSIISKYAF